MADPTVAAMATQITEKLDALDARVSESEIRKLIDEQLAGLENDAEFVRKIRFASGDPRLVGSKFSRMGLGVDDIEMLYMLTSAAQSRGLGPGPSQDLTAAFDALTDGRVLDAVSAHQADVHAVEEMFGAGRLDRAGFDRAMTAVNARAMDTAESGFGSQLIGAQYVGSLWAGARAQSRIFAQIPSFTMTAPTAYLPVPAAPPEMLFVSESTASNSSNYTTSKTGSQRVQVDAKKFVIHQMWSGEMVEDSIIPFLPFLREQAQVGLAHYTDSIILNGDTTNAATGNINEDDADPADTDAILAFDGLRHVGLVDNTANGTDHSNAAVTWDALVNLRKLGIDQTRLMDWGHPVNPADWLYIVNPELGDEMVKLDEVISIDKYGSAATVQTGEVANIARHPVISSIAMQKTEADGKVPTGLDGDRHQAVAFNRLGFNVGMLRNLQVKVEDLPATDQSRIVYSLRLGFGRFSPTGAASGIEAATVLYNIA